MAAARQPDANLLAVRDAAIAELFYTAGLRLSELVSIDYHCVSKGDVKSIAWIDTSAKEINVLGKGQRRRTVPMGQAALDAITHWLGVRSQWVGDIAEPALFISAQRKRLSTRAVQYRLQTLAQRFDLPERTKSFFPLGELLTLTNGTVYSKNAAFRWCFPT